MNPIILPAAAGLGLLFLFSSSSKASPATAKPKPKALDFQGRIAEALAAGDADKLMAIANDMQAAGLTAEAEALRTVALNLKNLGPLAPSAALPNPPLVVVPPLVSPSTGPLPSGVPISSAEVQRLQIAQAMAVDLRNTSRYKENQALVRRFQEAEGNLVVDGKYGPKSGLALARLGIIPPRPRYWARKTVQVDKQQYAAEMQSRAASDPARQADWTAASKVQNDPIA